MTNNVGIAGEQTTQPASEHPANVMGDSVSSQHSITIDGKTLGYTATAGRMVISHEEFDDDKFVGCTPKAQVFVCSYTLNDADPQNRPVVFAFNGGPGSPTLWLHFGLFGPQLIESGDVDDPKYTPYRMRENLETILTHADIVFIDPMTTGYSRPAQGQKANTFHGYSGDRDLAAETIRLWINVNKRWLSPKFLSGESYGTTRSAALAGYLLERHGISFNGLILISSILDFGTVFFTNGNDEPYIQYLPTYAATAFYHGKRPGRNLKDVVLEAEHYAENEYRLALARGNRLSPEQKQQVAQRVAELTGLSVPYVLQSNLRLEHSHYFSELLRNEGYATGRLDTRFKAFPGALNRADLEVDPAHLFILQAYSAAANHFFAAELGYENHLSYEIMYGRVFPWSYAEFENASVNSAEDLAKAMRANPQLKVYVANGYYDGATPFAAAEHVFAHLNIAPQAYDNIMTYYYEAGHMMYVHEKSRIAQSAHIKDFITWATGGAKPVVPAEHALDRG